MTTENRDERGDDRRPRQKLRGRVVSDAMDKTVVVEVDRTVVHPLYKRYLKRHSTFHVHDASNECRVGDEIEIVSCRPMSKLKRWRVREILRRPEG